MKRSFITLAALLFCPLMAVAQNIHEYKLDNGLCLLVKEDHRAPVVMTQVWYHVGSVDERLGRTGISHLLEHMMFQGTQKYGPGELSEQVSVHGGELNAFTSDDYTAYHEVMPANQLALSMELEADRMHNLIIDDTNLRKELQVVMEERRMRTEDKPEAIAYERFMATMLPANPYHTPTVGWMSDLKQIKLPDVQYWYHTYYAPNNAVVVVVGDVDPEHAYLLARKYFGRVSASRLPEAKKPPNIQPVGLQTMQIRIPAKVPYLLYGYRVPNVKSAKQPWEPYALLVLQGILADGKTSRLYQKLVFEKHLVSDMTSNYDPFTRYEQFFLFGFMPNRFQDVDNIQRMVRQEILSIQSGQVSEEELAKVKAQSIASKVYEKDSLFGQALTLGSLAINGYPWQLADDMLQRIESVTKAQVIAVAKTYFQNQRLSLGILEPQSMGAN